MGKVGEKLECSDMPSTKKEHTVEKIGFFQDKEVEKGRSQHQTQYLELNFSTNVTRINEKHKYMFPPPFFLITLHTPTNSQENLASMKKKKKARTGQKLCLRD